MVIHIYPPFHHGWHGMSYPSEPWQVRGPQIRQVLTLELDADRPEQALPGGVLDGWLVMVIINDRGLLAYHGLIGGWLVMVSALMYSGKPPL